MAAAKKEKRRVAAIPLPVDKYGEFMMVGVYTPEGEWVGVAIISALDRACLLWNIVILQSKRRRGYATNLIKALQGWFDEITTSWYSDEGRELCLRNGFTVQAPKDGKTAPSLVWQKEDEDAGETP